MSAVAVAQRRLARAQDERVDLVKSIPMFLVHLVPLLALWTGTTAEDWWICFWNYQIRMFAITGGFHRYFSHKTYDLNRVTQFIMGFLGTSAAQKGPLWWAAWHRWHHRWADRPEDVHSPSLRGFYWAHIGWILCRKYDFTKESLVKQWLAYPELRWLNVKPGVFFPPVANALFVWWLGDYRWSALIIGFFLSTVILYHCTFFINSLAHVRFLGSKRVHQILPYDDTSQNSFPLAVVTLGEGWHNEHHYDAKTTQQGCKWWHWDPTFYVLWLLQGVGIWLPDFGSHVRRWKFHHFLVSGVTHHYTKQTIIETFYVLLTRFRPLLPL